MIPLRSADIAKAFSQPWRKAHMIYQEVAFEIPTGWRNDYLNTIDATSSLLADGLKSCIVLSGI
jgi:hypothetical protein